MAWTNTHEANKKERGGGGERKGFFGPLQAYSANFRPKLYAKKLKYTVSIKCGKNRKEFNLRWNLVYIWKILKDQI